MVEAEMRRVSEEARVEAVDILRDWLAIATADPSKLMQARRVNCRYCWGVGHEYQWKPREYAEACDHAMAMARAKNRDPVMPDCGGGFGFKRNADPCPDCPDCEGEGVEEVFIADITTLSGPERRLFAGIKQTRNGPEVIMRDQDKARDNLARYLGMLIERKEIYGKDGKPLFPEAPPVELPTDPEKLQELYRKMTGG